MHKPRLREVRLPESHRQVVEDYLAFKPGFLWNITLPPFVILDPFLFLTLYILLNAKFIDPTL